MKKQKYNAVIDYRPRKPGAPPLVLGNNVARDEPGPVRHLMRVLSEDLSGDAVVKLSSTAFMGFFPR